MIKNNSTASGLYTTGLIKQKCGQETEEKPKADHSKIFLVVLSNTFKVNASCLKCLILKTMWKSYKRYLLKMRLFLKISPPLPLVGISPSLVVYLIYPSSNRLISVFSGHLEKYVSRVKQNGLWNFAIDTCWNLFLIIKY